MGTMLSNRGSSPQAYLPKTLLGGSFKIDVWTLFGGFETLIQRAVQRRQLGTLDDRLLQDIGVSSAEAYRESLKPFWRK